MEFTVFLISDDFIEDDVFDRFEDVLFDLGIHLLEFLDELLCLVSSRAASAVIADGAVLRETAGALDEAELVHVSPGDDILLPDIVERTDDLHAFIVVGMELRKHGLERSGIEHVHQNGLDDVVIVMP